MHGRSSASISFPLLSFLFSFLLALLGSLLLLNQDLKNNPLNQHTAAIPRKVSKTKINRRISYPTQTNPLFMKENRLTPMQIIPHLSFPSKA